MKKRINKIKHNSKQIQIYTVNLKAGISDENVQMPALLGVHLNWLSKMEWNGLK